MSKQIISDEKDYGKDGQTRFALGKEGDRMLIVFGLNPSTADENKDDPTMKKVKKIVQENDYDGFLMLNLYPLRATKPRDLPQIENPQIFQENIKKIEQYLSKYENADILLAYGNGVDSRQYLLKSLKEICQYLVSKKLYYLDRNKNNNRHPKHPIAPRAPSTLQEMSKQDFQAYREKLF